MTNTPQPIRPLRPVGGTWIATRLQATGTGQDILVEATPAGEHLAEFLALLDDSVEPLDEGGGHLVRGGENAPDQEMVDGHPFYVVHHSPALDHHLLELVDALIEIRIGHPRLVQLELGLSPPRSVPGPAAEVVSGPAASLRTNSAEGFGIDSAQDLGAPSAEELAAHSEDRNQGAEARP